MFDPLIMDVARRAGRLAADVCRRAVGAADAMSKGVAGPVTLADYGSQAVVLREIAAAFPDHGVLAEEGSELLAAQKDERIPAAITQVVGETIGRRVGFEEVCGWIDHGGGAADVAWVVDPIDGTKGYLRGDQFAVAIGILVEGVPSAGVLVCPRFAVNDHRGVLFSAGPGTGAQVEPLSGGPSTSVSVSAVGDAMSARVLGSVEATHGDPALVRRVIETAGLEGGMVRLDSQVKYAAVAAGFAEIYLRPRSRPDYREYVWDHAAGAAIVEHAGGTVTDVLGNPLDFGHGRRLEQNRGVLATNGRVHDLVLGAIGRLPTG